jgi:glycosyltransferase involved in cell wall biosynthesis
VSAAASRNGGPGTNGSRPGLLCLCASYAPETTPTAIRASKLLTRLARERDVTVITDGGRPDPASGVRVIPVASRRPRRALAWLRRLRMDKLLEWAIWPDESIFWVLPAIRAGRRALAEQRPEAIVVFMMPYSSGLAGLALRRLSGLPLVLNLDDSPTCTDMHPHFPSRLHHRLARVLEDLYVRRADAVVYVSQRNLELVAARQPERERGKLRLVRYGADRAERAQAGTAPLGEGFRIVYVGAMSGWWSLLGEVPASPLGRLASAWSQLGRHVRVRLDQRTSSPAVLGGAILDVLAAHPAWHGQLRLAIFGNPYPEALVARALAAAGVQDVVDVHGAVPHDQVAEILAGADLLFITLPARLDGSPGGRISAKTYEYLATDRPILAAVPRGESWDYLEGRPGVWLVEPDDRAAMKSAVAELAAAKLAGEPVSFDRRELAEQISYETRAREFAAAIDTAVGSSATRRSRLPARR